MDEFCDDLARIADAARCASKAAHPTDIVVRTDSFLVVAHRKGLRALQVVRLTDFAAAGSNLLVEAVAKANREIDSCFAPAALDAA